MSGFVNINLETLEERRLISSKAKDVVEDNTGSSSGAVIVSGYTSAPESAGGQHASWKRNKRGLKDFQNCRSLTLEEEPNYGTVDHLSDTPNYSSRTPLPK